MTVVSFLRIVTYRMGKYGYTTIEIPDNLDARLQRVLPGYLSGGRKTTVRVLAALEQWIKEQETRRGIESPNEAYPPLIPPENEPGR